MYKQSESTAIKKRESRKSYRGSRPRNGSPTENAQKRLIREAGSPLEQIRSFPFSKNATGLLIKKISNYRDVLISDSITFSKREKADVVSASHVEQGSINLTHKTSSRFFKHLGTLGGILLGASLSALLSTISAHRYSPATILIPVGFGIVGTFMIAFYIAKDSS